MNSLIYFLELMGFTSTANRLREKHRLKPRKGKPLLDSIDDIVYSKTFRWFAIIGGIVLVFFLSYNKNTSHEPSGDITPREYQIYFDSRVSRFADLVKEHLHDPSSFEFVKTDYKESGDDVEIIMTYRAKNGFGAIRTNRAFAKLNKKRKTFRNLIVEMD